MNWITADKKLKINLLGLNKKSFLSGFAARFIRVNLCNPG